MTSEIQDNLDPTECLRKYIQFLDVLITWEEQGILNAMLKMQDGWHP